MKTLAIVQARMDSTRLLGKVLLPILGVPMIELLLERLSHSKNIDQIVLATSTQASNEQLSKYVEDMDYSVYRGSENDVLDRYYQAACIYKADIIVRITGDCPLVDPQIVDSVINRFMELDYVCNINPPTYPDGLDVEVFSSSALSKAWKEASKDYEREHVTPYIRESKCFTTANVTCAEDYSHERWTVDVSEDLEVIRKVFEHFNPRRDFGWQEVLEIRHKHPEWFVRNQHLHRNLRN